MANNRMYLTHKGSGDSILLAKYYPSTGWYMFHSQEVMDEFLSKFNPKTTFGDTDFELRFESDQLSHQELVGNEQFPYNRSDPRAERS